jgi:hypothetical protein
MFFQTLANKLKYVWFKSVHFRRFSLFSNACRFRKRVRIRAHAGSATFVNVNAYWYVIFTRRNPYFNVRALILYVCEGSSQPIAKCKKLWYLYFWLWRPQSLTHMPSQPLLNNCNNWMDLKNRKWCINFSILLNFNLVISFYKIDN